jgi:hypothetical protein
VWPGAGSRSSLPELFLLLFIVGLIVLFAESMHVATLSALGIHWHAKSSRQEFLSKPARGLHTAAASRFYGDGTKRHYLKDLKL